MLLLWAFDTSVFLFCSRKSIFDVSEWSGKSHLEKNIKYIRDEYFNLNSSSKLSNVKDFYKVEREIGQDDNWKGFPLVIYNHTFINNIEECPLTYKIITQIPDCTSAMFSVLGPGKHILPHRGLYKGVIRCLFTIYEPRNGKSWIRIEEEVHNFKYGGMILFDETFEHEVCNESSDYRVVLYLDIYRKLPFPINILNRYIFNLLKNSPFILNILEEYSKTNNCRYGNHKQELKGLIVKNSF